MMDVDRLRPGTVPLAPEAVLWFEFLLDPTLLEKHLKKVNPDPSPTELIANFLSINTNDEQVNVDADSQESEVPIVRVLSKRNLALKILSLKIGSFLNWNLEIFETQLPLPLQLNLLNDLLYISRQDSVSLTGSTEVDPGVKGPGALRDNAVFAVILNHRLVVRCVISGALITKQAKVPFIPMPNVQDPNIMAANQREEIRAQMEGQVGESVSVLLRFLDKVPNLIMPSFHSFTNVTEVSSNIKLEWDKGTKISDEEFKCQVHFELGLYYFFKEDYDAAKFQLSESYKMYNLLQTNPHLMSSVNFCSLKIEQLEQYCIACDVVVHRTTSQDSLLHRFQASVKEHYSGIFQILEADNLAQEVPLVERDLLEINIQSAVCSGSFTTAKDFLFKIQVLNCLRRAITNDTRNIDGFKHMYSLDDKGVDIFIASLKPLVDKLPTRQLQNLKYFLFDGILQEISTECILFTEKLLNLVWVQQLFTMEELATIRNGINKDKGSRIARSNNTAGIEPYSLQCLAHSPRLEVKYIEQKLSQTFDPQETRSHLEKLLSIRPAKSWWKLDNKWDLPIPLQSVVLSLPKGFTQDFVYVMLAKAKELTTNMHYDKALLFLDEVEKEVNKTSGVSHGSVYKLNKLISWEVLLVQIHKFLVYYEGSGIDPFDLNAACKSCYNALQAGDSVIPRFEIMEYCAIALLNMGEWTLLTAATADKRWNYMELSAAIASSCEDIVKYKGTKKISREAWDLVLPVFGPSLQNKRGTTGSNASPTSSSLTKADVITFATSLREPTCFSVFVSLLVRMFNVLKDEPSLEINAEFVGLWPAVVSNSNSYNTRSVLEVLNRAVVNELQFRPKNIACLKILADLNFVDGDWGSAMGYYLEAAAISTDFFSQPLPKQTIDDSVFKRMIKCCSQSQYYTQAAVLCQFLDDIDYVTAFKCLSETKSSHSADAMDAYYPCIWDITILEYLVCMHSKRGETERKQQVVKLIGLLELNSNNNEEIQREAANIRKGKFLRALAELFNRDPSPRHDTSLYPHVN